LNLFIILSDIAIDNKEAYYRKFKNGFDFGRQCLYFFFICFNNDLGLFQGKIPGGVRTLSIIWGTTTRILIIFGVPPHKYKYLK
jgi:hypothetical protein